MFSKDEDGQIPAAELIFALTHHPGNVMQPKRSNTFLSMICTYCFDRVAVIMKNLPTQVSSEEICEMIDIVDKNRDGKISYR